MQWSVNIQLRKVTKNKRVFPNDESVFKILYLTIDYITRKWTMPIRDCNVAMAHISKIKIIKRKQYFSIKRD